MPQVVILVVAASPGGMELIHTTEEYRRMDQHLGRFSDHFVLHPIMAATPADLQNALYRHEPHLVHFSGHATVEELFFEEHGKKRPVTVEALKAIFALKRRNLRAVVLNACHSGEHAAGISESIDCAIGFREAIQNQDAVAFADGFYRALSYHTSLWDAVESGKAAMKTLMNRGPLPAERVETRIKDQTTQQVASKIFLVEPNAALTPPPRADPAQRTVATTFPGGSTPSGEPTLDNPVTIEVNSRIRIFSPERRIVDFPWRFPGTFVTLCEEQFQQLDVCNRLEFFLRRLYYVARDVHLSLILLDLYHQDEHKIHAQESLKNAERFAKQLRDSLGKVIPEEEPNRKQECFVILFRLGLYLRTVKYCLTRTERQHDAIQLAERLCHWLVVAHVTAKQTLDALEELSRA